MLPIISILNLISAFIFSSITLKVYFSYQQEKEEKLSDFLKTFFCLSLVFFLLASPGLIFNDLKIIGFIYAIYPFFVLMSLLYLGAIPLKILQWELAKKIFMSSMFLAAIFVTYLSLLNWGTAVVHTQGNFIYWQDTRGVLVNTIIGLVSGLGVLLIIIFFLIHALRASEKYVKTRAFLIIGGLLILTLIAIMNFVWGASTERYLTSIIIAFLGILSGIIFFLGIFYKRVSKKVSPPTTYKKPPDLPKIQW